MIRALLPSPLISAKAMLLRWTEPISPGDLQISVPDKASIMLTMFLVVYAATSKYPVIRRFLRPAPIGSISTSVTYRGNSYVAFKEKVMHWQGNRESGRIWLKV